MSTKSKSTTRKPMPFRPYIFTKERLLEEMDRAVLQLQTSLLVLPARKPLTPQGFEGADKVLIRVVFPEAPKKSLKLLGEFICGVKNYDEVTICLFENNDVSTHLGGMSLSVPLGYIWEIRSRAVS